MPTALFIAWRSGDSTNGCWGPVGRLDRGAFGYRFGYTQGARTLAGFAAFPEMPDLDDVYESDELFPLFKNRLLARSRPEYGAYLAWSGFDPDNPPDPIAILSVTEGLRQTDPFEVFPCPAPDRGGRYLTKFFLHGLRWMPATTVERVGRLHAGDRLGLLLDVSNEQDPHAVAMRTQDERDHYLIGYVPRYLARDIRTICLSSKPDHIELTVERVNRSAPMQQRLLCRMNAIWPNGFRPCTDELYQPIVTAPELATEQGIG